MTMLCYIRIYISAYTTTNLSCISFYFIFVYRMVILRSTTGLYGRPMIEIAYGKILFSLYRDCMGDDSSGRVVGVSTCCRPC